MPQAPSPAVRTMPRDRTTDTRVFSLVWQERGKSLQRENWPLVAGLAVKVGDKWGTGLGFWNNRKKKFQSHSEGATWNALDATGICTCSSAYRCFRKWLEAGVFLEFWKR